MRGLLFIAAPCTLKQGIQLPQTDHVSVAVATRHSHYDEYIHMPVISYHYGSTLLHPTDILTFTSVACWTHALTAEIYTNDKHCVIMPSVLWHCWLSVRKSTWPVKNWVMRCWHGYLSGTRCKWFIYGPADAMETLIIPCFIKSRLV